MNLTQMATAVILVAAIILIGLAILAPIIVQDGVNGAMGNGDTALGNLQKSLDNLNDRGENSALGEWLANLD